MSKVKNDSTPGPEAAARKAIEQHPGATVEGVAQHAGVARSTAGKLLARLVDAGDVQRHVGGREGGKRLPDRFTLKGVEMPAAYATHIGDAAAGTDGGAKAAKAKGGGSTPSASTSGKPVAASVAAGKPNRLKAGGLEPLVLKFLAKHKDDGPHGPTQVAQALGRSSGAVGNCLVRLTEAKKTTQVTDKPRRYALAA
jgi:hypothetical protein